MGSRTAVGVGANVNANVDVKVDVNVDVSAMCVGIVSVSFMGIAFWGRFGQLPVQ